MKELTWPALPFDAWQETHATLHMWLQIAGKIRMKQEAHVNHWWETTLYVTARGLTTSAMPYKDDRAFQIDFDFIDHRLHVRECDGATQSFALEPMPVATFYHKVMDALHAMDIDVRIRTMPNEVAGAVPFEQDFEHKSYDRDYAHRYWRVLLQADRLFKIFRARFYGKVSPVHYFWGAPDLALTRFSGRRAPPHPGGFPNMPDWVTRDAYSHEVSSAGFWAGGYGHDASFYSYAYPEPDGYAKQNVEPRAAYYDQPMHEFFLPYEAVRQSADPDASVLEFLQSTYEAAANLAKWDRDALERQYE